MIDYIDLCDNLLIILNDIGITGVENANKLLMVVQGISIIKKHLEGDGENEQNNAPEREDL